MQRSAFQGHFHQVEDHPDGAKPCGQQDDDGPQHDQHAFGGDVFQKERGRVPHMDFVQQIVVESRHIASGAAGKDDAFVEIPGEVRLSQPLPAVLVPGGRSWGVPREPIFMSF